MTIMMCIKIPASKKYKKEVQIGPQTGFKWEVFNDNLFGARTEEGYITPEQLPDFYDTFIALVSSYNEVHLHKLDLLKELVDYAITNNMSLYFRTRYLGE